jgi:hypothetical protein
MTLVIWGGEFGRTPISQQSGGRDNIPVGFTMRMAGGGVRGGLSVGISKADFLGRGLELCGDVCSFGRESLSKS